MLKNDHLLVIQRVAAVLTKCLSHLPTALREEAEQLNIDINEVVTSALTVRAELKGRPATGRQGKPPSASYRLEITNHAPRTIIGGQAVVDAVNEELTSMGVKRLLTVNNLNTTISTKGEWWRNTDTNNGVVSVSVRKAK